MILEHLREMVARAAQEVLSRRGVTAPVPVFDLAPAPPSVPGELAANVALMLAKTAGASPRVLAEEIAKALPASPLVAKTEIAGPGFINFWITDRGFCDELREMAAPAPAARAPGTGERIILEYVSANPTGPLHVGHGRGAALGDALHRILTHKGHEVTAEYYVNDAGGQIRNLGLSLEARIREAKGEPADFPEQGYKGAYVADLARRALEEGRALRPVRADQTRFAPEDSAGFASAILLEKIREDLDHFGVRFDTWFFESSLHERGAVDAALADLGGRGFLFEEEGALWFRATAFGDEKDRVLKKANEAPTYFAADIAYHREKFGRGAGRLINIWGADHHGYAQRIRGAMAAFGLDPEKLVMIINQMISIKGGRLSKRAGEIITLREVVDEVGRDAARFFFALRSPGAHFEFDLDLAKKQASENPVYYVQYVHARCCSIFREAEKRGLKSGAAPAASSDRALTPIERQVLLHLAGFERAVDACARDLSGHHLTVYLMELAGKYHSFYEQCTVLDPDAGIRAFRLDLVAAIRRRVAEGLGLLGVGAPETL